MRPRRLKTIHRVFVLVGLGAILAASTGVARADVDDVEAAYILAYGESAVCPVIAMYPTAAGVMGVVEGIHDDGFTYENAVEIVNVSVYQYCGEWWPLLVRIGRDARGETATTLTGGRIGGVLR